MSRGGDAPRTCRPILSSERVLNFQRSTGQTLQRDGKITQEEIHHGGEDGVAGVTSQPDVFVVRDAT